MAHESIKDIAQAMAQHARENPNHGIRCACKDHLLRAARQQLDIRYPSHVMDRDYRNNLSYLLASLRERL